jgi:hypothetical protein
MARTFNNNDESNVSETAPVAEAAPVAAPAPAAKAGAHMRKVTVDLGDGQGEREMNRKDYILALAEQGKSRGEITKLIQELPAEKGGNPEFKYQIVFQTTKSLTAEAYPNLRGGHKKAAAPAAPAEQPQA